MAIKLMIADDHDIFRKGLIDTLKEYNEIEFVGEARDGQELFALLKFSTPEVLLLDIEMPTMNGFEVLGQLQREYPGIRVIVISMYDESRTMVQVMNAGARGFLAKSVQSSELYKAITTVMHNNFYFNDRISRAIAQEMKDEDSGIEYNTTHSGELFSAKELQILHLLAAENTTQVIAEQLNMSVRTVDGIKQRMIKKAGAKNVIGLFMYAFHNELL